MAKTSPRTIVCTLLDILEEADKNARLEDVELFRGDRDGSEANLDHQSARADGESIAIKLTDGTEWVLRIEQR